MRCRLALLVLLSLVATRADTLPELQTLYTNALQGVEQALASHLAQVDQGLRRELLLLRMDYQKRGRLEGMLAVDQAVHGLQGQEIPQSDDPATRALLEKARTAYERAQTTAATEKQRVTGQYRSLLTEQQKRLTQAGDIAGALAVRDLIAALPDAAPPAPEPPAPTPDLGDNTMVLSWDGPQSGDLVTPTPAVGEWRLRHEGQNRIRARGVLCAGGRSQIEGDVTAMVEAIKRSGEMCLELQFEPELSQQDGPARIFSFSRNAHERNLTVGQAGTQLELRLRTSTSDANGHILPLTTGDLLRGKTHRLRVRYRPGELEVKLNGRTLPLPRPVEGTLDTWEPFALLLGNELGDARPWQGYVGRFVLSNRFDDKH